MYSTIYWLTRLDYIHGLFQAFAILPTVAAIIMLIIFAAEGEFMDESQKKNIAKLIKRSLVFAAISGVILCFIPTKNDAILIFAGGKAYDYYQKDTSLQKIPFKTTEYLKLVLDNQIKEIKEKQ